MAGTRGRFEDTPNAHFSHDWNFDVALDPPYLGLHSDANHQEPNGERQMETQWDSGPSAPTRSGN